VPCRRYPDARDCCLTDVPTLLALVFSGVGTFAAARSLQIQGREHKRLTTELAKRADFEIKIHPSFEGEVGPDAATYVTPATNVSLLFGSASRTQAREQPHTSRSTSWPQINLALSNGAGRTEPVIPSGRPRAQAKS
jgi:hypothetical protein